MWAYSTHKTVNARRIPHEVSAVVNLTKMYEEIAIEGITNTKLNNNLAVSSQNYCLYKNKKWRAGKTVRHCVMDL